MTKSADKIFEKLRAESARLAQSNYQVTIPIVERSPGSGHYGVKVEGVSVVQKDLPIVKESRLSG